MKTFAAVSIVFCLQSFSLAQFITWKDGKIGVDFGGYHAAAGLGGATGSGASGGLFAEAGTPHGQVARAGLAGATGSKSSGGGLYAGASAGGGVDAAAGLGGVVSDEGAAGGLYAAAEAGGNHAASGLGGATHQNGIPASDANAQPAVFTKTYTKHKKVHKYDDVVRPIVVDDAVPVPSVVDNTYSKHKSVYVGGFADGAVRSSNPKPAVYDSSLEASGSIGVSGQKSPTFFADIFNIPISTLSAVSKFLGNTASGANFQVRKEVVAESNDLKSGHVASSLRVSPVGEATKDNQSPPSIIDDIFNIPISTLSAVNKFLENNVPRKTGQVRIERQRRGPHGKRRNGGRRPISDIDMDSSDEVEIKVQ